MDHHCPWTYNCVSHRTLPHFIRFVFYAVTAMSILEYHIWIRGAHLWSLRKFPMVNKTVVWMDMFGNSAESGYSIMALAPYSLLIYSSSLLPIPSHFSFC